MKYHETYRSNSEKYHKTDRSNNEKYVKLIQYSMANKRGFVKNCVIKSVANIILQICYQKKIKKCYQEKYYSSNKTMTFFFYFIYDMVMRIEKCKVRLKKEF